MTKKLITTIDIEPTWETLCNLVENPLDLLPACIIADKIRKAQKAGALSITFTFGNDGIDIEEIYPDAMENIIQVIQE